jgi:hypothetical protein
MHHAKKKFLLCNFFLPIATNGMRMFYRLLLIFQAYCVLSDVKSATPKNNKTSLPTESNSLLLASRSRLFDSKKLNCSIVGDLSVV